MFTSGGEQGWTPARATVLSTTRASLGLESLDATLRWHLGHAQFQADAPTGKPILSAKWVTFPFLQSPPCFSGSSVLCQGRWLAACSLPWAPSPATPEPPYFRSRLARKAAVHGWRSQPAHRVTGHSLSAWILSRPYHLLTLLLGRWPCCAPSGTTGSELSPLPGLMRCLPCGCFPIDSLSLTHFFKEPLLWWTQCWMLK